MMDLIDAVENWLLTDVRACEVLHCTGRDGPLPTEEELLMLNCDSHYIVCRTMTDEVMACLFKASLLVLGQASLHPKDFGLDRAPQPAILDSKPSIRLKNQLDLTLSVKSSSGYYSSYYTECSG
jgi:hypothetical protein